MMKPINKASDHKLSSFLGNIFRSSKQPLNLYPELNQSE